MLAEALDMECLAECFCETLLAIVLAPKLAPDSKGRASSSRYAICGQVAENFEISHSTTPAETGGDDCMRLTKPLLYR
jgi:hypothetical protein